MANAVITIGDVGFDVTYTAAARRPATYLQPAEGGEIEIYTIEYNGIDFYGLLSDSSVETAKYKIRAIVGDAAEREAEERACAAEAREDERREARILERMAA